MAAKKSNNTQTKTPEPLYVADIDAKLAEAEKVDAFGVLHNNILCSTGKAIYAAWKRWRKKNGYADTDPVTMAEVYAFSKTRARGSAYGFSAMWFVVYDYFMTAAQRRGLKRDPKAAIETAVYKRQRQLFNEMNTTLDTYRNELEAEVFGTPTRAKTRAASKKRKKAA